MGIPVIIRKYKGYTGKMTQDIHKIKRENRMDNIYPYSQGKKSWTRKLAKVKYIIY